MKLQQTPSLNINEKLKNNQNKQNSQPAFKGAEFLTTGLNFLQTSPAVGATMIDIGCMGAPRTVIDLTRSPDAGLETARREFISTGNDAILGFYGMGAAALLANGLNSKYDIKADKLLLSDDAVDVHSQIWSDSVPKAQVVTQQAEGLFSKIKGILGFKKAAKVPEAPQASMSHVESYLRKVVANIQGYNPTSQTESAEEAMKGIDAKTQETVVKKLLAENAKSENLDKLSKNYLKTIITQSTGVEDRYQIAYKGTKTESSLDEMLEEIYKMTKTFQKGKVAETFKNAGKVSENVFVKSLKSLNNKTAVIGIGASLVIGLAAQPFNAYLTKKKTGSADFVGGGGENKSSGFKLTKYLVAATAGALALLSIGKTKKDILKNIQFKSLIPTIPQFKLVYGATIVSRLASSRNENELRETSFKDTLGFVNWLILGGFVSKLTAMAFAKPDDKFLKYNENVDGKGFFKKLTNSSTVTRNEVLINAYKDLKLDAMKHEGVAKTMKEMLQELKQVAKNVDGQKAEAAVNIAKHSLSKIRKLAFVQIAGYLYSGIVLGIGIPKANIAMTKMFSKKNEAQENKAQSAA